MYDLSIIIPTVLNESANKSFESIHSAINGRNIEVIVVVDNKNKSFELYDKFHFRFYYNLKRGVASARNYGASLASSNFFLFIDDDMLISRESIDIVLDFIKSNPNNCLNVEWDYPPELYKKITNRSFGRYLIKNGFTCLRGWTRGVLWEVNALFKIPMAASCFLFISKSNFYSVNGYNESFPFAGFEDYDFPKRLTKRSVEMYLNTTTLIYHNEENKTSLKDWMRRKVTGGLTIRIGVDMGYTEKTINPVFYKKIIYNISVYFYKIFIRLGELLPNNKFFDPLNFKYFNFLLGLSLYKGYQKKIKY